jgi:hypothetical protein
MRIRARAALVAAAFMATGCAPDLATRPGDPLDIIRLPAGSGIPTSGSSIEDATPRVVRTEAEWEAVWAVIWAAYSSPPSRPVVDFSRHAVVVVPIGVRRSGGYSVAITAATDRGPFVEIHAVERAPGTYCVTTAQLTHPLDAVLLPASVGEVRVRHRRNVYACARH